MVLDLINNAALLITLSVFYGLKYRLKYSSRLLEKATTGLWFGLIAVAGMMMPFEYQEGAIFDGRSIILPLSGLFGGGISALVSAILAAAYRSYLGGPGIWAGLATIAGCTAAGLAFRKIFNNRPEEIKYYFLLLIGVVSHIIMLSCQLLFPWPTGLEIIKTIWLPIMLIFPAGFMITGLLLGRLEKHAQAEKRIRETEALFRSAFYSIGDAVITTDLSWNIKSMNHVAEMLTGWKEADSKNRSIHKIVKIIKDKDGEKLDLAGSEKIGKIMDSRDEQIHLLSKDGNSFPIMLNISPIRNDAKEITGMVMTFSDQTRERARQKMVEESEERFRRLFENHQAVYLIIAMDGRILDANAAAERFYGWTIEELKQKKIFEINTSPEPEILKAIEKVSASGSQLFEFRHRMASGEIRDVETYSSKISINGESILHSIVFDVSEKKKIYQQLVEAKEKAEENDRLKSAFLENMSHEIRTPLNGILGFTDLITFQRDLPDDKKREYSKIIHKSADGLMQIIDDILDISKLDAGQLRIEKNKFDLVDLLKNINTIYQKKIGDLSKKINFDAEVPGKGLLVFSDEYRLTQIITNLLNNAIKFTDEGSISLLVKEADDTNIEICVKDTGIGIDQKNQELIFDRFRQVHTEVTRMYGGTGIGLSIVSKLVELMDGTVEVKSELGAGSCFTIRLPILIHETKPAEKKSRNATARKLKKLPTVLLVEDDPVSSSYYLEFLNPAGFNVSLAENGRDALQFYRELKPDIILIDIRLPDMHGIDIVKEIRKKDRTTRIIAQTAYAMDTDRNMAMEAGCDDYLTKPVKKDDLLELLGHG